jgi:hypothetical protein
VDADLWHIASELERLTKPRSSGFGIGAEDE